MKKFVESVESGARDIVFVGQPGRRDRTGSKVAQIPPKSSRVFDAV